MFLNELNDSEGQKTANTLRILHVDDEADQLIILKQSIKKVDPSVQIKSVRSPEKAIRLLQEEHYDCIISDYRMPEMNGIELARKIREISDIPFIIYTAWGSEELAKSISLAGIDGYFQKKLDKSHYLTIVKQIRNSIEKKSTPKLLDTNLVIGEDIHSVLIEVLKICNVLDKHIQNMLEAEPERKSLSIYVSEGSGNVTLESGIEKDTTFVIKLSR